jgi:CRISPR-associated protein Cmr6
MPIAAVPNYMGKDFSQASPGQRFGMYLPLWGVNQRTKQLLWKKSDINYELRGQNQLERIVEINNKVSSLELASKLTLADKKLNLALVKKQSQAFSTVSNSTGLCLQALSTAPFTTGLGNEHPLENGFSFLNPYGLPYLPGSGVKGVLRQAVRELVSGNWGESNWCDDKRHVLATKPEVNVSDIDILFGLESNDDATQQLRGVLCFWDVIPEVSGDRLMVEIMTPHQSHYYQKDSSKKSEGSDSPHDSGSPTPITFLTVPPASGFNFHVVCDTKRLECVAPDLNTNNKWKTLLIEAFEHAFKWLGFGAKTSAGYGAFERDHKAEEKLAMIQAEAQAEKAQQAKLARLTVNERTVDAFIQACIKRFDSLRGSKDKPNTEFHAKARTLAKTALEGSDWSPSEKRNVAEAITEWLPRIVQVDMKDERKKLKLSALFDAS